MTRAIRIAGSFVFTLAAYWLYSLAVVPMVRPSADLKQSREISQDERDSLLAEQRLRDEALVGLFPEGAWELGNPKVLESSRAKLLIDQYRNLGNGRVDLNRCTMIFAPDGPCADEAERKRRSIILEVPEGALLEFDKPLELSRMKIGRLLGGELRGRVIIRSQGKSPGPEDDLWITTRDVQMTEHHVWTPRPVDFQFGPNYGRGQDMRIKLLAGENNHSAERQGPNIAGIETFELKQVDRLHLELGKVVAADDKKPQTAKQPSAAETTEPLLGASELPVEITCKGPFTLDMLENVATFAEQVNVMRINPVGPSDHLNCELLSVFFTEKEKPKAEPPKDGPEDTSRGSMNLQPTRIEATGSPVIVDAPSEDAYARGQRLTYDLITERIVLDGAQEVILRHGTDEVHARRLEYRTAGPNRLGQVYADGPGWLRGQPEDRPDQQLFARWNEQLQVRPHEQNQVISLTGGAQLEFQGIGRLDAPEIHFYLTETGSPSPSGPKKYELHPDRMLACQANQRLARLGDPAPARHNVTVNSAEFSAAVEQLEVWFQEQATAGTQAAQIDRRVSAARHQASSAVSRSGSGTRAQYQQVYRQPVDGRPPWGAVTPAAYFDSGPAAQPVLPVRRLPPVEMVAVGMNPQPKRKQHFKITGRLLQAKVILNGKEEPELSELTVADGAEFVETQTSRPDEQPLWIAGDKIHAVNAGQPHAAVTVTGQPAQFRGRGIGLMGPNINLNRGTNRLWVDGAGQMDLPLDRDLEGRPLPKPGRLEVHWQDRMVFDGRTASFEDSVTANGPSQTLSTETLEVQFCQVVRFDQEKIEQEPQLEVIRCHGGVLMENRTFKDQQQASFDRFRVGDLTANLISGEIHASGPGRVDSVRRGSDDVLGRTGGPFGSGGGAAGRDPSAGRDPNQLFCLHVRFQGPMTGNGHHRVMTFHDQVHTAYAPVDRWDATLDPHDPDRLGPKGGIMHSDRLTVSQMASPLDGQESIELEAAGNTIVEGSTFTARAIRLTYTQAKDLLILEGDGRTDAELFRQTHVGGPTSKAAARKILYWPKTDRMKIDGARTIELSQFSGGGQGPP